MASAPTRRQAWQCDRAAPQMATQPLPTRFPNNFQQGRGSLPRWRLTVKTAGTTSPNLGTCAHSGFPPRSSTNRRHSELHSPKEMEMEASRTRRAGPAQTIEKQGKQRGQRPTHATIQTRKRDKLTLMQVTATVATAQTAKAGRQNWRDGSVRSAAHGWTS